MQNEINTSIYFILHEFIFIKLSRVLGYFFLIVYSVSTKVIHFIHMFKSTLNTPRAKLKIFQQL